VVWSDLIQGVVLLLGGLFITFLGFQAIGGIGNFLEISSGKLHTVLPWNHPEMPWVAVFIGGLWIPNIFYWGLNQFITQRTLGAKSLSHGQKGMIFAAFLKLLIPFIIVFPGIMAFHLYRDIIPQADQAYPVFIQKILPAGFRGVMFAALFGAVMSSLDSMLNSASTIFTIDFYKKYWNKDASSRSLVKIGRIATGVFVVIGGFWAPFIAKFGSVFQYIQKIWGFISPGIVACFLFGIVIKKAPPAAAVGAMILGIPVYGLCLWLMPEVAFLHHMAITFIILILYMSIVTIKKPLEKPREFPVNRNVDLRSYPGIKLWGSVVIILTVLLYIIFF
ncbi:MAG: sodium/solute symporter, partial [Candidatus Aminicenantes bacterium]|nr:sodium/solute symporter [Candidatus Aminicenantes bacterium]